MRLLIDFGAIKTGGGVQLAVNFLSFLQSVPTIGSELFLILPSSGPLAKASIPTGTQAVMYMPTSYSSRFWFEHIVVPGNIRLWNITHVLTFFGAGLPNVRSAASIVSCAYPIICYPDSAYWHHVDFLSGSKKRFVNVLRRFRLRRAGAIIVETDVMADRISKFGGVDRQKIVVIPPSPSSFISRVSERVEKDRVMTFLFLSGLDQHKNLWRLPAIASELRKQGFESFKFLLSVSAQAFHEKFAKFVVGFEGLISSHFDFLGSVSSERIQLAYDRSDFLVNLSDLESFSNNYMEAWKAGIPLICSDTDFARHICQGSAVYVQQHDPRAVAREIIGVVNDPVRQADLVRMGDLLLAKLPDLENRFARVVQLIEGFK